MQPTAAPTESVDAVAASPSDASSQHEAFAHSQPHLESLESPSLNRPSVVLSSPSVSRKQLPFLPKCSDAQFKAMPISAMDNLVKMYILARAIPLDEPPLPHDIIHVVILQCPELFARQYYASPEDLKPLIEANPELIDISRDCWERGSFQALRELEIFWPNARRAVALRRRKSNIPSWQVKHINYIDSILSQPLARVLKHAWTAPYTLNYHQVLLKSIKDMKRYGKQAEYTNTAAILQSSGFGKSRMLDEMASLVFTLPLNLRNDRDDHGLVWPPPDTAVRSILKYIATDSAVQRLDYLKFFTCLFVVAKEELEDLRRACGTKANLITLWREHLSDLSARSEFYQNVVIRVFKAQDFHEQDILTKNGSKADIILRQERAACDKAVHALRDLLYTLDRSPEWKTDNLPTEQVSQEVKLVIYFDGIHDLTQLRTRIGDEDGYETLYDTLRSVFNSFTRFPIFAVFLSSNPSCAYNCNYSQAMVSEAPFDIAPKLEVGIRQFTIRDLSTYTFMAQFGRPLWRALLTPEGAFQLEYHRLLNLARSKLSGKPSYDHDALPSDTAALAVADVRLCLDYEPIRSKDENIFADLVASHMRTIFSVPSHREFFRSGYPSEPILAEAAAELLNQWQSKNATFLIDTLGHYMKGGLLDTGKQGELVARALLTEAYDRAVKRDNSNTSGSFSRGCLLTSFIEELFEPGAAEDILDSYPDNIPRDTTDPNRQKFKTVFQKATVRFTHFVKLDDERGVTTGTLFSAFVRGMAFVADSGQAIIDLGIPVLLGDELGETAMTAILIQVKRRTSAGTVVALDVRAEDIGLFVTQTSCRPYCTLVMALGIQPGVDKTIGDDDKGEDVGKGKVHRGGKGQVLVKDHGKSRSTTRAASQNATTHHPRYNIFAYGCSSTVYKGISHGDKHRYALLLATRGMFHEHARQRKEALLKVWQLKPAWSVHHNCYHWVKGRNVGTATADTEEDDVDMVVVSEYDGGEGEDELTLPA